MVNKNKKISLLIVIFCFVLPIIIYSQNTAMAQTEPRYKIPDFQVNIDTVALSEVDCTVVGKNEMCEVPWVGEYIKGIYEYSVSIAAILATIVLMAAGLIWLTSGGSQDKVGNAKNMIAGSIVGLFLILSSYVVLNLINPNLTSFPPLTIGTIGLFEGDSSDLSTREVDESITNEIANKLGLACGEETLESIARKTEGKVTYNQNKRMQAGPENTVYFDCSSYASFLLACAGINPSLPAWTGSIFQENKRNDFSDNQQFVVGDLVGWPPENGAGHVFVYIGNNTFVDAHGGRSGRQTGNAIGFYNINTIKNSAARHNNGKLYHRTGSLQ